jgi:hypothetical protein
MRRLVIGLLVLSTMGVSPTATAQVASPRTVLAYYYTYWDPGSFDPFVFQPPEGYQSDDRAVMERQVQQAKAGGIDGFVVDWLGNGDRTDQNLATVLDIGQKTGFRATIHFETPKFWGVDDTIAQLQAFYENRINHPAMVRYGDRPVIFFWRASTYDNGTWNFIREQVDPQRRALWIADGDSFGIVGGDAWDGISPYAIAWSRDPVGQLARWAAAARAVAPDKLWVPPVSPGCDDSHVRSATCVQDRADGAYYQATWDGARASDPSWAVIVSTFNEWAEATQIEPSVQYGDQYLQITRQNAEAFRTAF